jgi:hypothetical protein
MAELETLAWKRESASRECARCLFVAVAMVATRVGITVRVRGGAGVLGKTWAQMSFGEAILHHILGFIAGWRRASARRHREPWTQGPAPAPALKPGREDLLPRAEMSIPMAKGRARARPATERIFIPRGRRRTVGRASQFPYPASRTGHLAFSSTSLVVLPKTISTRRLWP